ncbi:transposase [Oceanirhabdus seepicola]|uniref:Transposase n=1 Tax=Oceanirhabdus seepicola TaxID=2828781 RepID=A0A9J6NZM4_9CLOT|nr:transposase [Oceanirhabdus seepicola]MCM1989329.1 transposase [Oceanirhabdus seepicola]
MPRTARKKVANGIYHIICNSISDTNLFRDQEDKERYLETLQRYKQQYGFEIYSLTLMDTHVHILLDTRGADISAIMKSINISYVQYYNRRHGRKGGLFAGRFKSILINEQSHLYEASLYIHRNSKDLPKWKKCIEKYPYSSLGIFLGLREDTRNLINVDYLMRLFGGNINIARKIYAKKIQLDERIKYELEYLLVEDNKAEYRSERIVYNRNITPDIIVEIICKHTNIDAKYLFTKNNSEGNKLRAILVMLLRKYSGYNLREICEFLGNISQPTASYLSTHGLKYINNTEYEDIINEIKEKCSH